MAYQINAAATFTRPSDTTAYASGDLVANSTTNTSVVVLTFTEAQAMPGMGSGAIRRVRIIKSGTATSNASFRLHLYEASPTIAGSSGDNLPWLTTGAANYIGAIDCTIDKAFSDGACGLGLPLAGSECVYHSKLFGLLEARAAYAPVSAETFTIKVEAITPDY